MAFSLSRHTCQIHKNCTFLTKSQLSPGISGVPAIPRMIPWPANLFCVYIQTYSIKLHLFCITIWPYKICTIYNCICLDNSTQGPDLGHVCLICLHYEVNPSLTITVKPSKLYSVMSALISYWYNLNFSILLLGCFCTSNLQSVSPSSDKQ